MTFCEVVKNQSSGWQWIIVGEGGWGGHFLAREWQKVIKKWPSSAGYHPVFVETGREHNFFYIPEKNDSNLTYLKLIHRDNDSLEMTTDTSYSTLSNSRNLLKHLKVPHTTTRLTKSQISEIKKGKRTDKKGQRTKMRIIFTFIGALFFIVNAQVDTIQNIETEIQVDANTCSAACCQMILEYYGIK